MYIRGVGLDSLCGGDPDGRDPGAIVRGWGRDIGRSGWLGGVAWLDWSRVGARAVGNGQGLAGSGLKKLVMIPLDATSLQVRLKMRIAHTGVGLGSLSDRGSLRAANELAGSIRD